MKVIVFGRYTVNIYIGGEMEKSTKNLVLAGLFLALGLVLPFVTGQIPSIGNMLLPMHIPVLLAGFVCGWKYGLLVGFLVPLLRSVMFGMPPMFPIAIAMAFELATYGLVSGLLYKMFAKSKFRILIALIGAMIDGRIVWGIATYFLLGINGSQFTLEMFMAGAFINAIPGIIAQLILIPIIVSALERVNLTDHARLS